MKQTVEWLSFVIGGLLILTAVVSHLFKISLGGASVEGQSNWGQKIVAFVAGWMFIFIGGTFHGVGMYLNYQNTAAQSSGPRTEQSSLVPTASSDSDSDADKTPVATSSRRSQTRNVDLTGFWRNEDGDLFRMTQSGNKLSLMGAEQTQIGSGSVDNGDVTLDFSSSGIPARCELTLSSDARQMKGSCGIPGSGMPANPTTLIKLE